MTDCDEYFHSLSKEAEKAVDFIKFGVNQVFVSKKLQKSETLAYLNLKTLENKTYCVRLTINGYQIVSYEFDVIDETLDEDDLLSSESIDALLNSISPLFVKKFSESLVEKLKCLE
jgi:hypothetical protein